LTAIHVFHGILGILRSVVLNVSKAFAEKGSFVAAVFNIFDFAKMFKNIVQMTLENVSCESADVNLCRLRRCRPICPISTASLRL